MLCNSTHFEMPRTSQPESKQKSREISLRWGERLVRSGWTPVANYFLETYSTLSPPIKYAEAMFIIHLMQHQWDGEKPFPAMTTIAKRMGITTTSTRSLARSLERKGYVSRVARPGRSNEFATAPLIAALEERWWSDFERRTEAKAIQTSPISQKHQDSSPKRLLKDAEVALANDETITAVLLAHLGVSRAFDIAIEQTTAAIHEVSLSARIRYALDQRVISQKGAVSFFALSQIRNKIVHGARTADRFSATEAVELATSIIGELEELLFDRVGTAKALG